MPAAGDALAAAKVRFLHAVPGVGPAALDVSVAGREGASAAVGFAKASGYVTVGEGAAQLALAVRGESDPAATERATLKDRQRYTVVALRRDGEVELRLYRDDGAAGGAARLRAIHAAPELDGVDVRLGEQVIADGLAPAGASPYDRIEPGSYRLSITRPGGKGGALASQSGVQLVSGTSSTAVIVGSGGERIRFVVVADAAVTPAEPPATGLGGLSDGGVPWLLVLAAALLAGALGGAAYAVASGAAPAGLPLVRGRRRRGR